MQTVQDTKINQCNKSINKMKNKNHMISNDAEIVFEKIQHPFMTKKTKTKNLNKLKIEGNNLNIIKVYRKGHI